MQRNPGFTVLFADDVDEGFELERLFQSLFDLNLWEG
jgi:hypothetical protein